MNTSEILIIIYTVVFLIVSFIQYKQILRHKSTIENMEKFFNIFNLDEVVKYSDMRHETTIAEAKKTVRKYIDENRGEIVTPTVEKIITEAKESMQGEFEEQFDELANFMFTLLLELPKEERSRFMEDIIPKSKSLFVSKLEDEEKNNNF